MQPALLLLRVLPPPPSGTNVVTWFDGAGAGLTADARKAFVVQHVVRDFVFADELPEVGLAQIDEGVEFQKPVDGIELNFLEPGAGNSLLTTQPGDPNLVSGECLLQRVGFPNATTPFSVLDAVVEKVDPLAAKINEVKKP